MPDIPSSSKVVSTPNPNERAVAVVVQSHLIQADASLPLGTLYKETPEWADKSMIPSGYGDYTFGWQDTAGDDAIAFYFYKPKGNEQFSTPFIEYTEWKEHSWDAVLKWITFNPDRGMPLSANGINTAGQAAIFQAPRWQVKYAWHRGMTLSTKVLVRKFLSNVPFPDWACKSNDPMPTEVSWDLVGTSGSMGSCLHDDVTVPAQGQGGSFTSINADNAQEASNSTDRTGQVFPRTNHLTWQKYTDNHVQYVNGQYLRTEETFFPPVPPRLSVRNI